MKRPTWALVVGILGILLGSFGVFGSAQTLVMPAIMHLEKDMFSNMQKELDRQGDSGQAENAPPAAAFNAMKKFWQVPRWFEAYCIALGVTGGLLAGFYILASIWLILVKPYAIRMFYLAAGLSIALAVLKDVVALSSGSSFLFLGMMMGGCFGIVFNAVLIVVVATNRKDAFRAQTAQQPPGTPVA